MITLKESIEWARLLQLLTTVRIPAQELQLAKVYIQGVRDAI